MNRIRPAFALVIALAATACSRAPALENGVATDAGVAAIALPEEQLRFMVGQTVMGSQSGPMALYALGLDRGCDVFKEAADQAVASHLPQWRASLIQAYRDSVPPEELAAAVDKSPRAAREHLRSYLPAIGSAMKRASEPTLVEASTEIISTMSNEAAKVDAASIDQTERQQDLQRMKTEGKICGVGRSQEAA
jgi:hypothetical protein